MTDNELKSAVEAILFACAEPVSLDKIAEGLEIPVKNVKMIMESLAKHYNEDDCGICLVELDGEYQLCSNKKYAEQVRKTLEIRRNTPLSPAAMEVLAVVAYNQPVTKSFIEQVRGVDCSGVLSGLMTKGLIEEVGRLELPGRPLLYGTTSSFLRCMGISCIEELPPLPEKEEDFKQNPDQLSFE